MAYNAELNNETECDDDEYERWNDNIKFFRTLIIQVLRPTEMMVTGFFDDIIPRSVEREIFRLDRDDQQEDAATAFIDAILKSEDKLKWKIFHQVVQNPEHEMIQDIISGDIHEYLECHDHFKHLVQCIFRERLVERLKPFETMTKCYEHSLLTDQQREKIKARYDNHGSQHANMLLLSCIPRARNWYSTFLKILWETDQESLVEIIDPDMHEKLLAQESEIRRTDGTREARNDNCIAQGNEPSASEDSQEAVMYGSGQPCSSVDLLSAQETARLENTLTDEGDTFEGKSSHAMPDIDSTNVKSEETVRLENEFSEKVDTFEEETSQAIPDLDSTKVKLEDSARLILPETVDESTSQENLKQPMNILDVKNVGSKAIFSERAEESNLDFSNISSVELCQSQTLSTADQDDESAFELTDESNLAFDSGQPKPKKIVTEDKSFTLRSYQTELTESACQGKNVIICAPTGSGKTHVALHIINNHMASVTEKEKGKVIFLVNQKALAEQQHNVLKEHLGVRYRCVQVSGDTELSIPFKAVVERFDILVVTAQILVDALAQGSVESIQVFTLIVFDECHHTKDKHPFNSIMLRYLKEKYPNINNPTIVQHGMPQIVGLTASIGVGKAKTEDVALKHIRQIFANMDVEDICIVEKNKEELAKYTNTADHSIFPCPARGNDDFKKIVDTIMETIEKEMVKCYENQREQIGDSILKLPTSDKRWSPSYFQLISKMFKEFALIRDNDLKRPLESARRYLVICYTALSVNEDCRTKDAFRYLEEKIKKVETDGSDTFIPFEKYLHELFAKHKTVLENAFINNDSSENPKLKRLQELISQCFQENADSRVIVFVKTRELANALELWMKDSTDFRPLKAKRMVGACATAEKGGMTQRQQVDVLTSLREGRHKVIIATSVAQEGLDVPKCNMVIQYDYNTNEIAMVQARGRARAENSRYAVIASKDSSVENKEVVNLAREKLMNEAIQTLKSQIANDVEAYEDMKRQHQLGNLSTMILNEQKRQHSLVEGEFKLTCLHCGHLGCFSSDLRTIKGSQHVVIDAYFKGQIKVRVHPRPNAFCGLEKKGKLHCLNCGDEWGIVIRHRGHFYPVIKIERFCVQDDLNSKKTFRTWKEVNFSIDHLDIDENTCNIDSSCDCLLEE